MQIPQQLLWVLVQIGSYREGEPPIHRHLVWHAGVAVGGEVCDLEGYQGSCVDDNALLPQEHSQDPGVVVPAKMSRSCFFIWVHRPLRGKCFRLMKRRSFWSGCHKAQDCETVIFSARRHEYSTGGVSLKSSMPEDSSLCKESLTEQLWPQEERNVVHAFAVISIVAHPGRACWVGHLAGGDHWPKSHGAKLAAPLHQTKTAQRPIPYSTLNAFFVLKLPILALPWTLSSLHASCLAKLLLCGNRNNMGQLVDTQP